ncbi:multiple sugar transport system permease protein [Nonomuraea solani]|uniref:Multiple sugar transport system permease protein n=1 Tax=Nonomuraea solani TaxID=1144553 RepID=A0A1H5ULY1_9ACTN|nr:carbohydrate ABC transporter permease [Nonomuraea solani]SEF75247.1 multiple sugar transport system permease protein [Nonomuraea solani]
MTETAIRSRTSQVLTLFGLGLFALYSVAPVWWLIVSATKSQTDMLYGNALWFAEFNLGRNLEQVFTYGDGVFLRWVLNSFLYAGVGAAVCTLISLAAGYSLSRFSFRGRGAGLALVIGSFLIPSAMLTMPLYLLFAKVGLVDTVWAVLLPAFISPFSVYLSKVYVDGAVPPELLEAARVDGAGELRIFFQIVTRLMTTGAATVFLLAFVSNWNSFYLPLTMLRGEDKWPLSLGLYAWNLVRTEAETDLTALVLTGSLLAIVPLAVFMVAMRRYWQSGVTLGSLK